MRSLLQHVSQVFCVATTYILLSPSANAQLSSELMPNGVLNDNILSVVYHSLTGEISVDVPQDMQLSVVNITSGSQDFDWVCVFDNCGERTLIRATFGSTITSSFSFGEVVAPGLSEEFLLSDLTVLADLSDGGGLVEADLVYIAVPEPNCCSLALTGLFVALAAGRSIRMARVLSRRL